MKEFRKLSVLAIVSFFGSLTLCAVLAGAMIMSKANQGLWYNYPENIALITAALLISFLFSAVIQNKSELKRMREYFDSMALHDVLTGIYNRRYIDENINHLVKSVSRSNGVFSLMMIDVDFFRNYNETYGHNKGDSCLKIIAKVLAQSLKRDNDFVARYGSKEFIVVLPSTDENGAHMIADRLLRNIGDCNIPHEKSDVANHVTISIGGTTSSGNYKYSGDDYINNAKEALQVSEHNGCNRYTLQKL